MNLPEKQIYKQPENITKRTALFVATFAAFLTPFMGSALNVALPSIGKDFNADAISINWIASAYILATAIFLLPFGRIGDIAGRKKIFTYGILLFTFSSLLCGLSPNTGLLITFRVLQGISSAMIFGTSVAILTSVFPPGERGKALGINVASVYAGLSAGPTLGGLLTQYFTWRSIFFVMVPLGLITLWITVSRLKGEWSDAKGEKFDIPGMILYGLGLSSIMYGFSEFPGWTGYVFILSGLLIIAAFGWYELHTEQPLFEIRLLSRSRVFAFSNLAALIHYSATFGIGFMLSLYLQYIKDFEPREAGFILVVQPVIMAVFSPLTGRLSDKIQPRIFASVGMIFSSIGLFMLSFINNNTSLITLLLILVLLGIGYALFSSPNINAIMSSVERKYYGIASGTVGTMRMVGQMLSMGVALMLFSLFLGKVEIRPEYFGDFMRAMKVSFIIFTVLCIGGVFASLARGKIKNN
ncbi:MAG: MFS transporter [Bacteroidales bacterium]|nr:MFS transporter [Bacteroidales bacterium]